MRQTPLLTEASLCEESISEHPEPERVRQALFPLGVEMEVQAGPQFQLIAKIRTSQGDIEIR